MKDYYIDMFVPGIRSYTRGLFIHRVRFFIVLLFLLRSFLLGGEGVRYAAPRARKGSLGEARSPPLYSSSINSMHLLRLLNTFGIRCVRYNIWPSYMPTVRTYVCHWLMGMDGCVSGFFFPSFSLFLFCLFLHYYYYYVSVVWWRFK